MFICDNTEINHLAFKIHNYCISCYFCHSVINLKNIFKLNARLEFEYHVYSLYLVLVKICNSSLWLILVLDIAKKTKKTKTSQEAARFIGLYWFMLTALISLTIFRNPSLLAIVLANSSRGHFVPWYFGLVWFLCLMSYQLFLGYLMPKPFS